MEVTERPDVRMGGQTGPAIGSIPTVACLPAPGMQGRIIPNWKRRWMVLTERLFNLLDGRSTGHEAVFALARSYGEHSALGHTRCECDLRYYDDDASMMPKGMLNVHLGEIRVRPPCSRFGPNSQVDFLTPFPFAAVPAWCTAAAGNKCWSHCCDKDEERARLPLLHRYRS
jgi:hypothetical protein